MAQSTPVHKDLTGYRRRVGTVLTARTLACTAAAIGLVVPVGALLALVARAPSTVVEVVCALVALPVWLVGFWRPGGMTPEQWLPYGARDAFGETHLIYTARDRMSVPRAAGEARGGAWDVFQREWERRGRRVCGCELWHPQECPASGRPHPCVGPDAGAHTDCRTRQSRVRCRCGAGGPTQADGEGGPL